ncbi:CHAT domain-containing protein [Nocardia sp. NPDC004568]|uniref:CHAT domain-containing protein n=1 Tax=Nocardia sp. NPDC004568 TaxID=3154551 RepID=UPI0033AADAD7
MTANQYRSQLDRKRQQRIEAEKKVGEFRTKESQKRADAAKARQAAARSSSTTTASSKLREADRKEKEAETAGKEANRWQVKVNGYVREETTLITRLNRAERTEADAAERRRQREQQQADRAAMAARAAIESRIASTESAVEQVLRQLPKPKPEKLRVLLLGASSDGDLRVGREQKRIRAAVQSALHRDQLEFDVRPAATTNDLLEGVTRFRPHVVHFSGHSDEDFLEFEDEVDEVGHPAVRVTARAFAKAIQATSTPPLLILLNSCHSAAQLDALVSEVVPFAIGMADAVADADAINYAAWFYQTIANGQPIQAAHTAGQAALELAGLDGAELPTLASALDVDPATTILVEPMDG